LKISSGQWMINFLRTFELKRNLLCKPSPLLNVSAIAQELRTSLRSLNFV
jgi:hypothetical protein